MNFYVNLNLLELFIPTLHVTQVENALRTARTTQADGLVPLGGGLFRVWHHIPHLRVFSDVLCSW